MKKLLLVVMVITMLLGAFVAGCAKKDDKLGNSIGTTQDASKNESNLTKSTTKEEKKTENTTNTEPMVDRVSDDVEEGEYLLESKVSDELIFREEQAPIDYNNSYNEQYGKYMEGQFFSPINDPLSTFSVDVDTASYSNIRRFLNDGMLPPADAVRIEECINYFTYNYNKPIGEHPVVSDVMISKSPWNENRYLARINVEGIALDLSEAPPSNIVFLLDVSGSMNDENKLPLVKKAMIMLSNNLKEDDKVSIVVYAGASGTILENCDGNDTNRIKSAINRLEAGGSTAGGAGIELAYDIANEYFIDGGNNRVILCTDGDFNVGVSSIDQLEKLIQRKRESDIFLSVLGFGTGNTKDETMETLADKGNGNYAYIDSLLEAKKVLVNEMTSTMFTIAKDVKIQIEFNPEAIKEYRLVGYDNRILEAQDFNDDKKDAGEIGAGHSVTVFYELILVGSDEKSNDIDPLVFQDSDSLEKEEIAKSAMEVDNWMYIKLRYKMPDMDKSILITQMSGLKDLTIFPDSDFLFASAVAEYGLLLKNSKYASDANYDSLIKRARENKGSDNNGYRSQFIQLAQLAQMISDD